MVEVRSYWIVVLVNLFNWPVTNSDDSKIVGGFDVKIEDIPFIVSIQQASVGHFCGGAILTLRHVITGAHCVVYGLERGVTHEAMEIKSPEQLTVHAGATEIHADSEDRFFQKRQIEKIEIHPKCDYTLILTYDFAILYLRQPFRSSPAVKPFAYPMNMSARDFDHKTGKLVNNDQKHCYVAGWGTTEQTSNIASEELKAVRMRVIPDKICARKLGRENKKFAGYDFGSNAQLCSLSYGRRENASDCAGDSGGPFFCGRTVYGTVSYGFECGFWDTPNVYAKLSFAIPWINSLNLFRGECETVPRVGAKSKSSARSKSKSVSIYMPSYVMWLITTKVTLSS